MDIDRHYSNTHPQLTDRWAKEIVAAFEAWRKQHRPPWYDEYGCC